MNDERIDELRQRLRALGYLDAGVDRFVLAPARETRGPGALAIRVSLRVGLLGGLLLGPAAALGVAGRLPGLVSGVRDAGVLAIYLAIFFFVAIVAASCAVSLTASFFRGGGRAAAWVFTIGSLLYLTLWWRNANAGFGWSAPVWTSFALIIAVAISLLLGHAVRTATLAVRAARSAGEPLPPVSARSWHVLVGGGAVAFAGAAVLLVSTAAVEAPNGLDHPPLTVVSNGRAMRVIAIDGFDAMMFDTFTGEVGAHVAGAKTRLEPQDTSDPARAWTTVATGVSPAVHGVHAIETRRVAGLQGRLAADAGPVGTAIRAATDLVRLTRPSIASRDERRAKTFWEVAEEAGLRTAVVNWWASWPAPPSGAIVITDRALLRLEQGGALDAEIAPTSLYEPLRATWPSIRARARAAASQLRSDDPEISSVLRRSAELDASIVGVTAALPATRRDLDVVYLPGLDIAQYALLSGHGAAQAPSALAARVDAVRGYYTFLRQLLRPLMTPTPTVDVLLVTQPGRVDTQAAGILAAYENTALVFDVPDGVRAVAPGRVEDIAPTVLKGLGIPLSRELAGRPLPILLFASNSERAVDSYGRPFSRRAVTQGRPLDQETIDRLRSLGYIK